MRQFSDEELTAYLDGEAKPALVTAIDAARAARPELAQRLKDLDVDRDEIADVFHGLLASAPDMPAVVNLEGAERRDNARRPAGSSRLRLFMAAAACAAMLAVGAGAGYLLSETGNSSWRAYVAAYQALYVGGTLSHIRSMVPEQLSELDRVGKSLGRTFDLAALQQIDQLDYKRAQTLGFEGRPLVQLAFMSKVGDPVALCIIRSSAASTAASEIRYDTIEGMRAAYWEADGFEYLLIGGSDTELINAAAKYFAGVL
jgi:anti-sigma factor RsiW